MLNLKMYLKGAYMYIYTPKVTFIQYCHTILPVP
jgi:hypothetical protein